MIRTAVLDLRKKYLLMRQGPDLFGDLLFFYGFFFERQYGGSVRANPQADVSAAHSRSYRAFTRGLSQAGPLYRIFCLWRTLVARLAFPRRYRDALAPPRFEHRSYRDLRSQR